MWSADAAGRIGGGALLCAAALLASCERDEPTELGAETAAVQAAPLEAPAAPTAPSRIAAAAVAAADAITEDGIRGVVAEIADDRYGGRAPGTPGDKLTRAYLVRELQAIGFEAGGADGGWEQAVELVGVTTNAPAKWRFTRGGSSVELARNDDFIAVSGVSKRLGASRTRSSCSSATASRRPNTWDDFKGVDVARQGARDAQQRSRLGSRAVRGRGAALLRPLDVQVRERSAPRRGGRHHHSHDAVGGLSVASRAASWGGAQYELPAGDAPQQVEAWMTEEAARACCSAPRARSRRLIEQAKSRDFKPVPLGVTTSLALTNTSDAHPVGERGRGCARQRSRSSRRSRDLYGAP